MPTKPTKTPAAPKSNVAELPVAKARPTPATETPVVAARAPLKKKDFIDLVATKSGMRKAEAKTAAEAVLAVLAEALVSGQEVNLPPLGKLKVVKEKAGKVGRQYVLRMSPPRPEENAKEGLAATED